MNYISKGYYISSFIYLIEGKLYLLILNGFSHIHFCTDDYLLILNGFPSCTIVYE